MTFTFAHSNFLHSAIYFLIFYHSHSQSLRSLWPAVKKRETLGATISFFDRFSKGAKTLGTRLIFYEWKFKKINCQTALFFGKRGVGVQFQKKFRKLLHSKNWWKGFVPENPWGIQFVQVLCLTMKKVFHKLLPTTKDHAHHAKAKGEKLNSSPSKLPNPRQKRSGQQSQTVRLWRDVMSIDFAIVHLVHQVCSTNKLK